MFVSLLSSSVAVKGRIFRLMNILPTISTPADVKRLDYPELTQLAQEIRDFLVAKYPPPAAT